MADEPDCPAEEGPDRPEVGCARREGDGGPDGENDGGHREVAAEVDAHRAARRGSACGTSAGIVPADAFEWQVREASAQIMGRLRLKDSFEPSLVLIHRQIALGERLAEQVGRLLPLAVTGEHRNGVWHVSPLRVDVYGINIVRNVNVVNMPAQRSGVKRRDSYHHGDLKRALTSAALALVAEKGPRGFSLTEAARRAGVSPAAPYRHFADKAGLLAAVAEQGFRDLHADLAAAAARASDPRGRVLELGRAYVRWGVNHPDHYRVMFGGESLKADHPDLAAAAEEAFGDLLDAIVACQEAGVTRGNDALQIAAPLWSLVHGIASLAIGGDLRAVGIEGAPEDLVNGVVGQLL